MHGLPYLAALYYQSRLHPLAHGYQVVVHGAHGEQARDGGMVAVGPAVGQNDVVDALVDAALRLLAQAVEGLAESLLALAALEGDGQLDCVEALVAYVAQYVELRVVQYGVRQSHHLAVGLVGLQNARAHAANVFGERHYQVFAQRVDGGVGNLGELLPEVVEQRLRPLGEYGQRSVVAHRGGGLAAAYCHRNDGRADVFLAVAEHQFAAHQVGQAVVHAAPAPEFLELYAVGGQPLAVGMRRGQALLDFAVVVDAALLRVDEQDLARLQAPLLGNLGGVEVHHAHLAGHHHHVVLGDGVARRAQAVAVEHAPGEAPVAEEQRRRAVPRLHQYGVVLVERLEVFRDGVLVVEALWHHQRHGVGQREPAHDEKLEHVVKAGRVAHARLHYGRELLDVAQRLGAEHALAGLHPPAVAPDGVYLAVVGQQAEGLRQAPRRERVGREARVHQRQPAREVAVG